MWTWHCQCCDVIAYYMYSFVCFFVSNWIKFKLCTAKSVLPLLLLFGLQLVLWWDHSCLQGQWYHCHRGSVGLGSLPPQTSCTVVFIIFGIVFAFCVYVHGFEEDDCMYIKGFPLTCLVWAEKVNFGASEWGVLLLGAIICAFWQETWMFILLNCKKMSWNVCFLTVQHIMVLKYMSFICVAHLL